MRGTGKRAERKQKIERFMQSNGMILHGYTFIKWMFLGVITGIVAGAASIAFGWLLRLADGAFGTYRWLVCLLPVGGIVIAAAYQAWGGKDRGANLALTAVRANADMPLRVVPLIFCGTVLTHLFGGSAGREGAALQIGGGLASWTGRKIRLDEKDARVLTMCGMSAAFAALFGTPIAAAVFAMEVISVGVMYYAAIVPCFLSALVGTYLSALCGLEPVRFAVTGVPPLGALVLVKTAALGILCALLSILFCVVMHRVGALYKRLFPHLIVRAVVGGGLVVLLTLLIGTRDYNGAGGAVIASAFNGESRPEAFFMKIIFTALTLGAGYKGGEIVPAFFVGATFGNVLGRLLRLSPSLGAGIGLTAVFCGVTNCPMTSILLAVELFDGQGIPFVALACGVSYLLSGYYGLYSEQRIVYSKLKPVFVNRKTNHASEREEE